MKQTKPHHPNARVNRRAARMTAKGTNATPPPRLDRWTYPSFLKKVKAAKTANHKVAYLQNLCKVKHPLSREQARRSLKTRGFAPRGKLFEAKMAYLIHTAVMHAKATPRAHWLSTEELRQLTRRVNADEAHRTMVNLKLDPVIPSLRSVQVYFIKFRVNENKVIVRDRIRMKNKEVNPYAKRTLSKKETKAYAIMKEKSK